MSKKLGAAIPTQHPAMKSVAKSWKRMRERSLKKDEKALAADIELRSMENEITEDPSPEAVAKSELKAQQRIAETRRKLNEQALDTQIQYEADLQIQSEKEEFQRQKAHLKKVHQQEREISKQRLETEKLLDQLESKEREAARSNEPGLTEKEAGVVNTTNTAVTGPQAILEALQNLDTDAVEEEARGVLRRGLKTKRPLAVSRLQYLQGLKRNGMKPSDLMITKVPVMPPSFRPYSAGDTLIAGDINLLYKDLLETREAYKESKDILGDELSADARLALYDAVKATYGFGDPVSPKLRERGVSGSLQKILGSSPKYGVVQRRLLSKTQDNVGRSTIVPDPELGLDEIGIPEDMAWQVYQPFVIRRLVKRQGYRPAEAIKAVKDRSSLARRHLDEEMTERPVLASRAPAWHKHSALAMFPRVTTGRAIKIPNMVTTGFNADFDGDDSLSIITFALTETARQALLDKNLSYYPMSFSPDTTVPTFKNGKIYMAHISDFPRGELLSSKVGQNGPIDLYSVPEGVFVIARDESSQRLVWAEVKYWSVHKDREVEIVDLSNNYQIVTDDDPRAVYGYPAGGSLLEYQRTTPTGALAREFLVPRVVRTKFSSNLDMVPLKKHLIEAGIRMNDKTARHVLPTSLRLDRDSGWLIGAFLGDGWCGSVRGKVSGGVYLATENPSFKDKFTEVLCSHFGYVVQTEPTPRPPTSGNYGKNSYSYCWAHRQLSHWLARTVGHGCRGKRLPDFFLNAPKEFQLGLFAGLMDTDGSISVSNAKKKPQLMANYGSVNIKLIQQIQILARNLGIRSRITKGTTPAGEDMWVLSFSNQDIQAWGGTGLLHPQKLEKLASVPPIEDSAVTARYDVIPISHSLADFLMKAVGHPKLSSAKKRGASENELAEVRHRCSMNIVLRKKSGTISRQTAKQVRDFLGEEKILEHEEGKSWLGLIADEGVTWDTVKNVQKTGIRETGYDLTVPGFETFMSVDGVILSNTMNIHVPATQSAVDEAKEKLLPSRMIFSARDPDRVVNLPKHEMVLGVYNAKARPSGVAHQFGDKKQALEAVLSGKVRLNDDVVIDQYPLQT
jgi:hypothetical protein